MSSEEFGKRFKEEVKLRAYRDKYVDRKEEDEILRIAIDKGIALNTARGWLLTVCEAEQYVLESVVIDKVKDALDTFVGNDGQLDEKEFNDAVSIAKKACQGKKTDIEIKKMVITLVESGGSKVKTGLFSNWYKKAKKDVGM